jgi:HD-GYP domain-containing protein (c-di-GMP phosphodiesterase class II)
MRAVALLARDTGRELGIAPEALDELVRAAELHDVGKMAIPDEILDKHGPLSPDDWTFLRSHTVVGERILGAAAPLGPVAELVRGSHERWDGAGYPDGLRGEDIPLGSRVIAVCDAYDTMVSERH